MSKSFYTLLAPQNLLVWAAVGKLWLLTRCLSYRALVRLGHWLGRKWPYLAPKACRVSKKNLEKCFPALTEEVRRELWLQNCESMGMAVVETGLAWWATERQFSKIPHRVHGLEAVQALQKEGRGILFCSAHFTTLEIVGRLLSQHLKFSVMYRPQKLAVLDFLARHHREKIYTQLLARQDLRGLIRTLREGGIVWYTPDIDAGVKNSVFAPFFGVPAATLTTTSRLAVSGNAVVVPIFFYRREDASYDIVLQPPLQDFPSGDEQADAEHVNHLIEDAVRESPSQYLWQYKRFKTRPPGEARFYGGG